MMSQNNGRPGLRQKMNKRFNAPYEFSFKDLLAIVFVAGFLYISWRALKDKDAIELVRTWMPILMTVLGGYFGTEVASAYFISKNPMNQNGMYNGYNNYGYYNNYNGGYNNGNNNTTGNTANSNQESDLSSVEETDSENP